MLHFRSAIAILLALVAVTQAEDTLDSDQHEARQAFAAWKAAGSPSGESPENERLTGAAVRAGRPDLLEAVLAGGPVMKKMIRIRPDSTEVVPLQTVKTFRDIHAQFDDEMFASFQRNDGWLVRRITANRIEVWTSKLGRLFDEKGRLLHQARPPRRTGTGREWFGAFLPDGRWVTTDLDDTDGTLSFFSAAGKPVRYLTWSQLAPGGPDPMWPLLGWGRSDKTGTAWIVNVGSEEGVATIQVTPDGKPRVLQDFERWQACYPRMLGPRGTGWWMRVPNDAANMRLDRSEAGHGPRVGYPDYTCLRTTHGSQFEDKDLVAPSCIVPHGNYVFGFWPRRSNYFIGADGNNADFLEFFGTKNVNLADYEPSGVRTRKYLDYRDASPVPIIDKTWFFDEHAHCTAWIRARRLADAADGRSMLFRVTADSRIVTLTPDLKVRTIRRFTWKDGTTADALTLWDDLKMGLFIRSHRLYLARW